MKDLEKFSKLTLNLALFEKNFQINVEFGTSYKNSRTKSDIKYGRI